MNVRVLQSRLGTLAADALRLRGERLVKSGCGVYLLSLMDAREF